MTNELSIPVLNRIVPSGFKYGQVLMINYEPDSLWYETSLTIAALGLKDDLKVEYHTYQHFPSEVRSSLADLGIDVKRFEAEDKLRIEDSYTGQTGLGLPEAPSKKKVPSVSASLKLSDTSIAYAQQIKVGIPESDKRVLHIDDDVSVIFHHNDDKTSLNFVRTRLVPWARAREMTILISWSPAIVSEALTKEMGTFVDGIIDFKSEEREGEIQQYVRVRTLRGHSCDSRWRKLRVLENSEVTLVD